MRALAAPAIAESEAERVSRLWGTPFKHEKFSYKLEDGQFQINTRGTNALCQQPGDEQYPRTIRKVKGDFEATVTLVGHMAPNRLARFTWGELNTMAGLYVAGDGTLVRVGRARRWKLQHVNQHMIVLNDPDDSIWMDEFGESERLSRSGMRLAGTNVEKPVQLRIVRKGGKVSVYSKEKARWSRSFDAEEFGLPEEVEVGVYLSHTTTQDCEAVFADFRVEKK